MYTIVEELLLLSAPRFDKVELGLPVDDPAVLLPGFPLDKDRCNQIR